MLYRPVALISAAFAACTTAYHVGPAMPGSSVSAAASLRPAAVAAAAEGAVRRRAGMGAAMAVSDIAMPHSMTGSGGDGRPKKVFVLGGDGFCGWPSALHLAEKGHEVVVIDNLSRRKIDVELGCDSLTPIAPIEERVATWNGLEGTNPIRFVYMDLAEEYDKFTQLLKDEKPDTLVHFAEQRAAPYSMKNAKTKRYTIENNLGATHNVLCGIVESGLDIHLVHLGTMGVYGYGNSGGEIPEGYIDVILPGDRKKKILHPAYPGSIYHTTKCLDALLFQFYAKNDLLRVTDLHQGIVWGTNTDQTKRHERLTNRFDYDGEYGTVLNRFLMQAATGIPLTVYGTGGQTRAFIHVTDTCRCIELAVSNPPSAGQPVEILNQVAETARVRDVAEIVARISGAEVQRVSNPRQEDAENELVVANNKFKLLGLDPILPDSAEGLMTEVTEIATKFADRCDKQKVISKSYWNKARAVAAGSGQGGVVEQGASKA